MIRAISYCASLLFTAKLSVEDIKEKRISIYNILFFATSAVIYRVLTGQLLWKEIGICLIPGSILLLLALLTKESIGYGDGMAVLALGLWTNGWFALNVVCIGIVLSGIWGMVCLFMKKKEPIPFMPFLLIGMEVAFIFA